MRVGIALGSNLGDRAAHLRAAIDAIRSFALPPVCVSRFYETSPVDCPPESPLFLNAAIEIGSDEPIEDLLHKLQAIEQSQARPALHERNAPRTIDLDILYADDLTLESPALTLPHPRLMSRLFVLRPLCDIAPDRRIPGHARTFREQAAELERTSPEICSVHAS